MRSALVTLVLAGTALAQPATVVYQGFLLDAAGTAVTDTVDMHFRLHGTQVGGTALWSETVPGVDVSGGFFSVELGINQTDLSQDDLWLEIAVGAPTDVLVPRQPVASAPWALRCARAQSLGGQPATAYQVRVNGSCSSGDWVRVINNDGSVMCETDDVGVGALNSVTGSPGLTASGSRAVVVDVAAGPGVLASDDLLELDFSGSGGAAAAARSDHAHGEYVPLGGSLTCIPGQQAFELDPTGNLFCDVDLDNSYGVGGSGNLQLVGTQFSLPSRLILSQLTAASYHLTTSKQAYYTINPAEFAPDDSGGGSYQSYGNYGYALSADPLPCGDSVCDFPTENSCNCPFDCGFGCGSGSVLAPIHLPQGVVVTQVELIYSLQDPSGSVSCLVDELDLATGTLVTSFFVGSTFSGPGIQVASTAGGMAVDNLTHAYVADCLMWEPFDFASTQFYGLRLTYQFTELTR